jgi:hypothetical protein
MVCVVLLWLLLRDPKEQVSPLWPCGQTTNVSSKYRSHSDGLCCVAVAPSEGPKRGVFLPSPEDGNRSSIRNAVFSSFLNTGRWTNSESPTCIILGRCSESKRLSLLVNIKEYDIQTLQQSDKDTAAHADDPTIMDPQVLPLPCLVNCCEVGGNALEFKMSWHRGRQKRPPKNDKTLSTRLESKIM